MTKPPGEGLMRSLMESLDELAGLDMVLRRDKTVGAWSDSPATEQRGPAVRAGPRARTRKVSRFVAKWLGSSAPCGDAARDLYVAADHRAFANRASTGLGSTRLDGEILLDDRTMCARLDGRVGRVRLESSSRSG